MALCGETQVFPGHRDKQIFALEGAYDPIAQGDTPKNIQISRTAILYDINKSLLSI